MKIEDIEFLYGKGHICTYCELSHKDICRSPNYIKEYARKERGIYEMSIQILDCKFFTRSKPKKEGRDE